MLDCIRFALPRRPSTLRPHGCQNPTCAGRTTRGDPHQMNFTPLQIPDVIVFEPKVFGDERGFFYESFNHARFEAAVGYPVSFVQDNHSKSVQGVLRGLHYQIQQAQGKLVRVVQGEVFDVAVDLRKSSPTFGRWVGERLSAENKKQLWVPAGFAHGVPSMFLPVRQPASLASTSSAPTSTIMSSSLIAQ